MVELPKDIVTVSLNGLNTRRAIDEDRENVFFTPGATTALGVGLLGLAAIATWQIRSVSVLTWSTSPIENTWASVSSGHRFRGEGRCLMSVHDAAQESRSEQPQTYQRHAWAASSEVRRILVYLWALVLLSLAFFGTIFGVTKAVAKNCPAVSMCRAYIGNSWSLLPDTDGVTSIYNLDTTRDANSGNSLTAGLAITILFIMAVQSFLTVGLHCAELLVNMSRDEYTWRETSTKKGYKPKNAVMNVLSSPKTMLLLALKPLIHWVYGLGVTFVGSNGTYIRPPQLLYLTLSLVLLATFATYLCFQKPKGPQPATFGHVQTLVDLIDVYGHPLYWGHKSGVSDDVAHAGTATTPLPPIMKTEWYAADHGV